MHVDPSRWPPTPVLGRRPLMAGAAAAALLATAGCNPFATTTRITQTVTAAAAPVADPIPTLIATTRLHLVRLTNAVATEKSLAPRLTPLRGDRHAHLLALITELGRTSPQSATDEKARPTTDPTLAVPTGNAVLLLAAMRSDASLAQGLFTDAFGSSSRYRAALFGSIAACLATHRLAMA